jgi:putative tryptophan/tyrosine transport system substrate-binding protein
MKHRIQFLRRRRAFITLRGAAAAWPLAARAQQGERMLRIAVVAGNMEADPEEQARLSAFRRQLAGLGWLEGHSIRFDYRWAATDEDRIRSTVAELVSLKPDAILTQGTPLTVAAQQQTRTIPIVFTLVADPVGSGLVASLAHPGANITGFTNFAYAIGGKWLEVLKEGAPRVTRALAIQNPANAGAPGLMHEIESGAHSFGVQVTTTSTLDAAEMERTIEAFAHGPNGGLIVLPDSTTSNLRASIVALAARHRLPAIYPFRYFAVSGGLISYGIDTADPFRRAASYVDRILRGEKPADLPVQAPNRFELVINLKTAKALGIEIPPTLLARADEVIE